MKGVRLPRLSRRGKLIRNLAISLMLAVLIWSLLGYPLPTDELRFRRVERENLVEPTQIVLTIPRQKDAYDRRTGHYTAPNQRESQLVGLGEGYAVSVWLHPFHQSGDYLSYWPLDQQPGEAKLVPMVTFVVDWREPVDWSGGDSCSAVTVLALPAGTVRGEMEVLAEEGLYRETSEVLGEDLLFFAFASRLNAYSGDWIQGLPYTLKLYDADDTLLLEQEGTVPRR